MPLLIFHLFYSDTYYSLWIMQNQVACWLRWRWKNLQRKRTVLCFAICFVGWRWV